MTLPISNVVTVNIDRQTLFPQGPGFGTMLIVSPSTTGVIPLLERVRTYSSFDGVAADFNAADEEYKAAQTYFSQNPRPTSLAIGVRDPLNAIADEMDAIVDANNDWYAAILTSEARISDDASLATDLAAWIETRSKLFVTASNEAAAIAAGGGLPGALQASGYDRSMCFYHQDAGDGVGNAYPEAAFLGRMLTVDFDGVDTTRTGKFKTLSGIEASPLTQSELDFLLGDPDSSPRYGNAYVTIGGRAMTVNGTMASGEFFDVMHFLDWLQAEIQTRVFGRLALSGKVPYTNAGMEELVSEVRLALAQGVANGGIATRTDENGDLVDAFEVSTTSVLLQSAANRSARVAPPISFTARLAGAVHKVTVNGTVSI